MKFGICYRPHLHKNMIDLLLKEIDFVEIMPDIMNIDELQFIKDKCDKYNIDLGLHCLKSSLFSPEGPQKSELEKYYYISKYLNSVYYSDHISISHYQDRYLSSVIPIAYTKKNIEVFKNNYRFVKRLFSNNIFIENITQFSLFEQSTLTESEFIHTIVKENDVKLMFDFTNMYITARNNNIDFMDYCKEYPFDSVDVIHISGIDIDDNGRYQDNHSKDINEEVMNNFKNIRHKLNPKYVLIERDFNIISPNDVLKDLNSIKKMMA